jgi:hypothetical protein
MDRQPVWEFPIKVQGINVREGIGTRARSVLIESEPGSGFLF